MLWHLWIGRARNPGPGGPGHLAMEVFNVGSWLTHERVDTKNAFDELVCAPEESGDNGLVVLDEDVKEQILDAIKDGLGADCEAAILQR